MKLHASLKSLNMIEKDENERTMKPGRSKEQYLILRASVASIPCSELQNHLFSAFLVSKTNMRLGLKFWVVYIAIKAKNRENFLPKSRRLATRRRNKFMVARRDHEQQKLGTPRQAERSSFVAAWRHDNILWSDFFVFALRFARSSGSLVPPFCVRFFPTFFFFRDLFNPS